MFTFGGYIFCGKNGEEWREVDDTALALLDGSS